MDLIGYHECGRRLGVSDTAVRKAIARGRIEIAGKTEKSGRPLVDWDIVKMVWNSSGDVSKRSHVGSQGGKTRVKDDPEITIPDSAHMDEVPVLIKNPRKSVEKQRKNTKKVKKTDENIPEELPRSEKGGRYADFKADREQYEAKLAQLKYETQVGIMVNAEEIKAELSKQITAAKTRIMGIPSLCKSRYSDLSLKVISLIEQVCIETLEDLANGRSD